MSVELRITLPGPEGSADAQRAAAIFEKAIEVLSKLDRSHGETPSGERTTWSVSALQLGSFNVGLMVATPREGITLAQAQADLARFVDGFSQAEAREGVPRGWPLEAAKAAADLTKWLGATENLGMILTLTRPDQAPHQVTITRQAGDNLTMWRQRRQETIGSLIGHLDGVTSHDNRHEARLWLDHPNVSVRVSFHPDQFDEHIRPSLRRRVMVVGRIERDDAGTPLSIRLRPPIEILPGREDAPPLTDFAGADPDFTGDSSSVDHVRRIRDSA